MTRTSPGGSVVIAGCGDLGTEVGLRLVADGRRVVGLRRRPEVLPTPLQGHPIDLATQVPQLPSDVAAVVVATTADRRDPDAYRRAYVSSLEHVLAGLDRVGTPAPVVFVSSTAVYGDRHGEWVDEDTPVDPGSATAAVLLEAERLLHDSTPHASALRLAGLYGPGRTRMIDRVREGAARSQTPAFSNRIHRDDAAAAIVHLLTADLPAAPVLVASDGHPTRPGEVERFVAAELGLVPPDVDESREPSAGKRCRNRRLLDTGFRFTYPSYREGYRAVLAGHGTRHP